MSESETRSRRWREEKKKKRGASGLVVKINWFHPWIHFISLLWFNDWVNENSFAVCKSCSLFQWLLNHWQQLVFSAKKWQQVLSFILSLVLKSSKSVLLTPNSRLRWRRPMSLIGGEKCLNHLSQDVLLIDGKRYDFLDWSIDTVVN